MRRIKQLRAHFFAATVDIDPREISLRGVMMVYIALIEALIRH